MMSNYRRRRSPRARRGGDRHRRRRPPRTPICSAASRRRSSATRTEGRRGDQRAERSSARLQPGDARARAAAGRAPARPGRPAGGVFLLQLRGEANEAAFKISRLTGRPEVVTAEGLPRPHDGRLALTGQPGKAGPFAPLPGGVRTCPTGTPRAAGGPGATAMVCWSRCWARAACCPRRRLPRRRRGAGAGRGRCSPSTRCRPAPAHRLWFATSRRRQPRRRHVAKALGAGCRWRLLAFGEAAELLTAVARLHFGGTPVAAAAALAAIDKPSARGLLERARAGAPLHGRHRGAGQPGCAASGAGRAARRRPHAPVPPRWRRRCAPRLPHQRRGPRRAPAAPPLSYRRQVDAFVPPCPRLDRSMASSDPGTSSGRRPHPASRRGARPGRPAERTGTPPRRARRWPRRPGRGRWPSSSTSPRPAPGCRSPSASPSSAGTRW
jgi:acetylornithine aminotransferase